jgi:2-iminobutanoate/2-iminopropanoate deaminase
MSKKIVQAKRSPKPVGPYNQAVITGQLVYASGQIPLDPQTGAMVAGGIKEQTRQVLVNVKNVLDDAGTTIDRVIKATVFLKNMGDFADMNSVYSEVFKPETAPARSTIEVARLPKDALVEIEVVATL